MSQHPTDPTQPQRGRPGPGPYGLPPHRQPPGRAPQAARYAAPSGYDPPFQTSTGDRLRRWVPTGVVGGLALVVGAVIGAVVGAAGEPETIEVAGPDVTTTVTAEPVPAVTETVEIAVPGPTTTVTAPAAAAGDGGGLDLGAAGFATALEAVWGTIPSSDQQSACQLGPDFAVTLLRDRWTADGAVFYDDVAQEFFERVCA